MRHFLARLVERARGTAANVEPILAPRFAAVLGGVAEVVSETEAPPPVRSEARPPAGTGPSARPAVVSDENVEPAWPAEEVTERSIESPPDTLLVPPEQIASKPPLIVRRTETEVETKLGQVPAKRNPFVQQTAHSPSLARFEVAPPRSPPPATAPRRASRSIERAGIVPNESKSEPPIVRVTIGRIEVRAAPAPAAPSRKTAPSVGPKLTLDAYLKSRREGAR